MPVRTLTRRLNNTNVGSTTGEARPIGLTAAAKVDATTPDTYGEPIHSCFDVTGC